MPVRSSSPPRGGGGGGATLSPEGRARGGRPLGACAQGGLKTSIG